MMVCASTTGQPAATAAETPSGLRRGLLRLDDGIGRMVELLCAALLVVEIVVLFSGVVARYVLHVPLVWSDELARCCSCGCRCWARSWPCGAASTCA